MQLSSLIPMSHFGHYLHWHFLYISVSNVIVVAAMLTVFVMALIAPFPHASTSKKDVNDVDN